MSVVATVPSLNPKRPDVRYEIERYATGDVVLCDCPASTFGKSGRKCKHVAIYQAAASAVESCARKMHRVQGKAVCLQCLVDLLAKLAGEVERSKNKRR